MILAVCVCVLILLVDAIVQDFGRPCSGVHLLPRGGKRLLALRPRRPSFRPAPTSGCR